MVWIEAVTLLALLQYLYFGAQVGKARGRYGVRAPAVSGDEMFERVYRVQMNTLELLVAFLPALWLAARHAPAGWVAAIGLVYLVGRAMYSRAYTRAPGSRSLGFGLSLGPIVVLMLVALAGLVRSGLH